MKSPAVSPVMLAVLALFSCAAQAQDQVQDGSAGMPTVVVTASGVENALRDAPASISVITRADIEKRPLLELAELLGTVEGVTLTRSGNQVPGVQLRGLGSAYTLFLVDGKRVNSTSVSFRGNDFDTGWVPTSEIERIEVVRGPMSSLYGSDAIGGVVNIITRKVGKAWRGSLKLDAVRPREDAAGDTNSASASVSGPLVADVLGLRLSAGYDRRDGDRNVNPLVGATRQPGFPLIANRQFGGQLAWTPNQDHDLKLAHDSSRRDHGGFVLEREASSLSHAGRYAFGRSDLTLNADQTRNLVGVVTGQVNPNKANTTTLDGKLVLPWEAARQTFTVGGEIRREKLFDPTNITGLPGTPGYRSNPRIALRQEALFLEDEIGLREGLKLTVGDRYDRHPNFGGHHSPRAYLVWHTTQRLTVKGGWARAFRAPTLLQGSQNWGSVSCGSATVGCYIVGSPELNPETSTSRELGLQYDGGKHGAGLTVFHNDLKDMIDISNRTADRRLAPSFANFVGYLADGRPIFAYQNIARVRTRGLEASARTALTDSISLRANYTYTHARNLSGARELPLVYRPKHAANLALDWRASEALSAGASVRLNGRQFLNVPANGLNLVEKGGYAVADLQGAWRWNRNLTLSGGVLNVGDRGAERLSGADFNEEGRRLFVSLLARF